MMDGYTNYRRGFLTRDAAEAFQIAASAEPAYSPLDAEGRSRGYVIVRDPIHLARGRVYVQSYEGRNRRGENRTYFCSYIGS
jgi:hypothetical protein